MPNRVATMVLACLSALALTLVAGAIPSRAQALDWHWTPHGGEHGHWVAGPHESPRRYYVMNPPPTRPTRVRVHVRHTQPKPATVHVRRVHHVNHVSHVEPDPEPVARDPYDTDGIVVVGAGAGGLVMMGDSTQVAPAYRLHLGLAVGQAEFALRSDLAPTGIDVPTDDGGMQDARMYTAGATFNYRFIEGAVVHPVAGAGLETIILDPAQGETGTAFGATMRAGLEFAYPISDGALALGLDVTGHLPFAEADGYPGDADPMLTFGAYMDYRF